MKMRRISTVLTVILLTLSSFTFMGAVSADENPEPNLQVEAYVNDPDSPSHGHDEVAKSGETDIIVESGNGYTEVDNKLSVSAQPIEVHTDSQGDSTKVFISISGAGFGEKDSYASDYWSEYLNPHKVELYAQQSDFDGDIDIRTSHNTGVNTGGEEALGDDWNDEQAAVAFEAASFLPVVGTFFGIASFAGTVESAIEENHNKMIEAPSGASGPGATVGAGWYIQEKYETLYGEEEGGDSEGVGFAFSTEIVWEIDQEDWDKDNVELDIWAEMENELYMPEGGGGTDYIDGAETDPITIKLKNAEPQMVDEDLDTDWNNYYTSSYAGYNKVYPELNGLEVTNPAGCSDAKYTVEIEYKREWKDENWDTAPSVYATLQHGSELSKEVTLIVPDDAEGQEVTFRYTSIEAWDRYGGWVKDDVDDEISIYVYNNDGGPPPGGGCPYVSPYNSTKYKRDNNILVQSEFKDGEVTDYYKLDNNLAERNGNYSLKIEEFENSEDYIDQMKLYTLDHKEGYKVGVTPEGEYMTYKDSEAPTQAYTSDGEDILEEVEAKNDGQRLEMEAGSEITLDYGDRSLTNWKHNKLVLRSSGFSSYTDESDGFSTMALKTSLYVKVRDGNSDWYDVTTTHPRNNPHDHVIPLEDTIHEMLKDGHTLDDMEVKIRSTKKHNVDYVGLDDSTPTPVKVEEADLLEVMKTDINGTTVERTERLKNDDSDVVNLIPGEEFTVTFEATDKFPGNAFEERDFIIQTTGWYEEY